MIAIGIGCRKACPADDIVALVQAALARLPPGAVAGGLFTVVDKRGEPGLAAAAIALDLPLVFLDRAALQQVALSAKSYSRRVEAMFGLPSIAETAALAGAGKGAALLVERLANATSTCAIAGPAAAGHDTRRAPPLSSVTGWRGSTSWLSCRYRRGRDRCGRRCAWG